MVKQKRETNMGRILVIKRSREVFYIDRKSIKSYLKISSSGKKYRVKIVLRDPRGKIFSDESEGPRTSRNLLKLIGEAVTEAFIRRHQRSRSRRKKVRFCSSHTLEEWKRKLANRCGSSGKRSSPERCFRGNRCSGKIVKNSAWGVFG
ncbi:conserved hypothetical protein [Thermotoga petrophila RKU-10]|jgi:hypothetical protein|uniref:Uncharacterized protein n=1 Tax=Thermotoga petrophila (strain ATCC BAA-489 / DSM 13996 / JCM 10882 / RKU-10) TaxID=590168 RepID=D2C6H6_THEP2|nr:hypothetical protein TRQ2_0259 [Thermotoga sp. RQ2]ADA66562.1 conserved hypothetical protein [Thermotoga petrophila RKU-10]KAF2959849.1 hypothetical protein AS158_05220 [Thermotoga sp. 38H-to]